MKRILFFVLLFISVAANSQLMQTNNTAGGYQWVASKSDSLHIIPRGADTPNIGGTKYGKSTVAAMFYKTTDSTLWIRSANKWNQVTGSGGTSTDSIYYRGGTSVDSFFYTKDGTEYFWYANPSVDRIIYGGIVTWTGTDLDYYVSACYFRKNGIYYLTNDTTVTLPALAAADSSRTDVFIVQTLSDTQGQTTTITGTESANPITPQVDGNTDLYLTHVTLNPGQTTGLTDTLIVYDNLSGGEFEYRSSTGVTTNFSNTTNVYRVPYSANVSAINNNDVIGFGTETQRNALNYLGLSFFIKLKTVMPNNNGMLVSLWNNGVQVSNEVGIPFNRTNLTYQGFSVPMESFGVTNAYFDSVRFRYAGGGAGISGMYFDFIYFQANLNPGGSTGGNNKWVTQGSGIIIDSTTTPTVYNISADTTLLATQNYVDSSINVSGGIQSVVAGYGIDVDNTDPVNPIVSTLDTVKNFIFEAPIQANEYGDTVYIYLDSTGNGDYSIAHHSFGYYLQVFLTAAQAANTYITYDSAQGRFVDTGYTSNDTVYLRRDGVDFPIAVIPASSGGGISEVIGDWGLININDSTLKIDSFLVASRARVDKVADSLGVIIATKLSANQAITVTATGDATGTSSASGTAPSLPLTLATVNSNVGTFGSSTQVPVFTVNGKGLVTGVTNTTISGGGSSTSSLIPQAIISYGDSVYAAGDSYTFGSGPTSVNNAHIYILKSKYNLLLNNLGASGASAFFSLRQLYASTSYLPTKYLTFFEAGFNDLRRNGSAAKTIEKIKGIHRSVLANGFLSTVLKANDALVTKSAGWSKSNASTYSSKSIQQLADSVVYTSTAGATLTFSFTGDNLFSAVYGTDGVTVPGGTVTITVDGTVFSTWTTYDRTDGVTDANGYTNTITNNGIFLTGLGNGSHTAILTVTSLQASGIVYVDYFGTLDAPSNVKPVFIGNYNYLTATGYAAGGAYNQASNSVIQAGNTALTSVLSEFRTWPAFLADLNSNIDTSTCIAADNIHPNNVGARAIARAYDSLINPAINTATVGTINAQTKSANGAVITAGKLFMQTADASSVGIVSATTQTFAGAKTFNDNMAIGAAGKTLSWGTNSLNSLALMIYDNGSTTRYGMGISSNSLINLLPSAGSYIFRNGTALTGGTDLFTIAGSTGNVTATGTASATSFTATGAIGTARFFYYPSSFGVGINNSEVQYFNSNSTRWTWNMGGALNATGTNEVMRLTGGTAAGTGTLSIGNTAPSTTTVFDVSSTTRGSLPFPRMTTTQRDAISLPATGLCVYNTTTNQVEFYNVSGWLPMTDQQSRVSTQFDKNNNALANITGLTANLAAGKTYKFEAILYTTSNASYGVQFGIGGTATATAIIYEAAVLDANVNAAQTRATALGTAVGAVTAVTNAYTKITGTITCNAAGTLTVQFAQNVTNATVSSVLVGSTFKVSQIL